MHNFFVAFAVVAGLCSLAGVFALCLSRTRTLGSQWPPLPDAKELERREYNTMLRHRRRAKLEKEWAERQALQLEPSQQ